MPPPASQLILHQVSRFLLPLGIHPYPCHPQGPTPCPPLWSEHPGGRPCSGPQWALTSVQAAQGLSAPQERRGWRCHIPKAFYPGLGLFPHVWDMAWAWEDRLLPATWLLWQVMTGSSSCLSHQWGSEKLLPAKNMVNRNGFEFLPSSATLLSLVVPAFQSLSWSLVLQTFLFFLLWL